MDGLVQFLVLLGLGYFFGRWNEAQHFKSIRIRERASRSMTVSSEKKIDPSWNVSKAVLVCGSVAVSADYFKLVASSIKSFFGGRVSVYESLLDRARREAVLRMKEAARKEGAQKVINLRIETSPIGGADQSKIACVEVIAYGTALRTK